MAVYWVVELPQGAMRFERRTVAFQPVHLITGFKAKADCY